MTKLQELTEKRAAAVGILTALNKTANGRVLTDEEQTQWDAAKAERDSLDQQMTREAEVMEEARKEAAAQIARGQAQKGSAQVGDPQPYQSFGENCQAAVRSALNMKERGGEPEPRLRMMNDEMRAATGAGETVGADGGFLVEKDIRTELLSLAYGQGEILSRVNPVPIGPGSNGIKLNMYDETSRATGSRFGNLQMYWVGEGDAPTASGVKTKKVELELQKLGGLSYATDELLQDYTAYGALLERAFVAETTFMLENGIFQGTGSAQPNGILQAGCLIRVDKQTGQTATTINTTNISKMWARMWPRSRPNSVWLYNADVGPKLDELFITAGTGAIESKVLTMGADGVARIKGRPAVATEYNATLGTVGDLVLADFSQYLAINKGGLQSAVSIHVQFTQDETTLRFMQRFNGTPTWQSALTPFAGTGTLSPFVALATRA